MSEDIELQYRVKILEKTVEVRTTEMQGGAKMLAAAVDAQAAQIVALQDRLSRLEATVAGMQATKRKRATQMPSVNDFIAKTPEFIAWVSNKHPELFERRTAILLEFSDYHSARGNTMISWEAAARTWFRNASRFEKESGGSYPDRQEKDRISKMASWAEKDGNGELDF